MSADSTDSPLKAAQQRARDTFRTWKAAQTRVARCRRPDSRAAAVEACMTAEAAYRAADAERNRLVDEIYKSSDSISPPAPAPPVPPAPILYRSYHAQCPVCLEDLDDSECEREDGRGDPRASAIRSYEMHWRKVHAPEQNGDT